MGMYVKKYAYFCDLGTDRTSALSNTGESQEDGWLEALVEFGHGRLANRSARSAVLATAAAKRCVAAHDPLSPGDLRERALFVACGTGVGMSAHFCEALVGAPESESLEARTFGPAGPNVLELIRYSSTMLAGTIAQRTGIKGENRTMTGRDASLVALLQAQRFLSIGRARQAVIVCGESLCEWRPRMSHSVGYGRPREVGCALLVAAGPDPGAPSVCVEASEEVETPAPYVHLEAANALLNLCWALEQPGNAHLELQSLDRHGTCWNYRVHRAEAAVG
jgi:hypothetical protein